MGLAGLAVTRPAADQDAYPNKPVKVIINSSPGGLTDVNIGSAGWVNIGRYSR